MMAFPILLLLAGQAAVPPQLIDIEGLSTKEAGELILAGNEHRDIVAIGPESNTSLAPPGQEILELAESPVRSETGCRRRLWIATFQLPVEGRRGANGLRGVRATDEVALASDRPCELKIYSGLGPGVSPERGLALLAELRAIANNTRSARFECKDSTGSGFCRNDANIRATLGNTPTWHIMEKNGEAVLWLGGRGDGFTEARFGASDVVKIDRRIPAPA